MKQNNLSKIIIPIGMKPHPRQHEIDAAEALARYFKTDIEFVLTSERKTADFLINGILWELKSPQGKGKNNIQRQLQLASHQSRNVIIDASRSKMHSSKVKRETIHQFMIIIAVERLLYISKDKKVTH